MTDPDPDSDSMNACYVAMGQIPRWVSCFSLSISSLLLIPRKDHLKKAPSPKGLFLLMPSIDQYTPIIFTLSDFKLCLQIFSQGEAITISSAEL